MKGSSKNSSQPKDKGSSKNSSQPKDKGSSKNSSQPKDKGSSKNSSPPKDKGSSKNSSKPKDKGSSKNSSQPKDKDNSMVSIRRKGYEKLFHIQTESTTECSSEDVEEDSTYHSSTQSSTDSELYSCTESTNESDCLTNTDTCFSDDNGQFDHLIKQAMLLMKRKLSALEVSRKCVAQNETVMITNESPTKVKSASKAASVTYSDDFCTTPSTSTACGSPIERRYKKYNKSHSAIANSLSLLSSQIKSVGSLKNYKLLTKNEFSYKNNSNERKNLVCLQSVSDRCSKSTSCDVSQTCSLQTRDMSTAVGQVNKGSDSSIVQSEVTSHRLNKQAPLFYFYSRSDNVDWQEDEEIQEFIQVPQDDDHIIQLVSETCFNKTRSDDKIYKRIYITRAR